MTKFIKQILAAVTVLAFVFAMLPISAIADVDSGNTELQAEAGTLGVDIVPRRTKDLGSGEIWDGSIAEGFAGGSGTEDDPYLISNGAELAYLAQTTNSGTSYSGQYFKLTADIYLNDTTGWENWGTEDDSGNIIAPANAWTAIGTSECPFSGRFDGAGYAVSGIYINTHLSHQGLFGYNRGVIANLGVIDSYIKGDYYAGGIAGRVVGYDEINSPTIINCYNSGVVSGSRFTGGITGFIEGNTIDCYNQGMINGRDTVGGIVGMCDTYTDIFYESSRVVNCHNTGMVIGVTKVGGIAGRLLDGETINCHNKGAIYGDSTVGGVVGENRLEVKNSYNVGTVSGNSYVGGVTGEGGPCDSYNTGVVSGNSYVGGVTGKGNPRDSYNTGVVSGDSYVGGVTGSGYSFDCYNIGTVTGNEYVGGVVGYSSSSLADSSYYLDTCCAFGDSYGGIALTEEQLQQQESYEGFDFDETWTMAGDPEYPYAELRSNPHFISPDEPGILGDFDGDGEITATDAVNILRVALGILNADGNINADYDCDGDITALDAIKVLRVALGLTSSNILRLVA